VNYRTLAFGSVLVAILAYLAAAWTLPAFADESVRTIATAAIISVGIGLLLMGRHAEFSYKLLKDPAGSIIDQFVSNIRSGTREYRISGAVFWLSLVAIPVQLGVYWIFGGFSPLVFLVTVLLAPLCKWQQRDSVRSLKEFLEVFENTKKELSEEERDRIETAIAAAKSVCFPDHS